MAQPARSPRSTRSSSSLSSQASTSRTSLLSDDTAPTSMSGSFYDADNCCHCELANEAELCKLYREHERYTRNHWYGPLPLSEWKELFLPVADITTPTVDFTTVPAENGQTAFVNCLRENDICSTVFPRAAHAVHAKDHITGLHHSLDFTLLSEDMELGHDSRRTRDELLGSTLAFGVMVSKDSDPCAFSDDGVDANKAASLRGRLAVTAHAIAANSHRTLVHAFVIMPELARLIRFDHNGVIYSELFPWRTSSDLIDILVRFDCMSGTERGCDTSVIPITMDSEEALRAKEILGRCNTLPNGVKKSTIIPLDYRGHLSLMNVYDDETKTFHRVAVHRAISSAESFIGRATRGFYGVDLDEELVVYVKDAWRVDSPSYAPEAATYRRLAKHNVPHLAGFYLGGDVPENTPTLLKSSSEASHAVIPQSTARTYAFLDEWFDADGEATAQMRSYTHHRLLFKKIGRPLKTFESTRQLCVALLDAMEAHGAAYENAEILHRDISGGNILIDQYGRGMLIDWDMCVWLENKEEAEKVGQKVGTWRFISVDLLEKRQGPRQHLVRDDLESFAHVLFYHVLRYRPTVIGRELKAKLRDDLYNVFDVALSINDGKSLICSPAKAAFLNGGGRFPEAFFTEHVRPQALVTLIYDILEVFAPIYTPAPQAKPYHSQARRAEIAEAARRHEEVVATCVEQLGSTEYLASRFRHWIYDYRDPECPELDWSPNDGAIDQLQPLTQTLAPPTNTARSSRKRRADDGAESLPRTKSPRLSAKSGESGGVSARTTESLDVSL